MNRGFEFTTTSTLNLPRTQLWQEVTNMQGVNYELAPFVKMTLPKEYEQFTIQDAPVGEKLFTSIILFFKFIPVDIHHFRLDQVVTNERFEENSTSLMHQFWRHTRILRRIENGTEITDVIQFLPRLPLIGYLLQPVYQFVFRNRHQRLRNKFNIIN